MLFWFMGTSFHEQYMPLVGARTGIPAEEETSRISRVSVSVLRGALSLYIPSSSLVFFSSFLSRGPSAARSLNDAAPSTTSAVRDHCYLGKACDVRVGRLPRTITVT